MKKERIDIVVPESVLAENGAKRRRLAATLKFEPADRVPVFVCPQVWSRMCGSGVRFSEMLKAPREHLRGQILGRKWRIETAGSRGGYILSEGFGLASGTPLEHISALVEASVRVGNIADLSGRSPDLAARLDESCVMALAHRQ